MPTPKPASSSVRDVSASHILLETFFSFIVFFHYHLSPLHCLPPPRHFLTFFGRVTYHCALWSVVYLVIIAPSAPDALQSNSSCNLRCCYILIGFPVGETCSVFFYYMTFLLDLEGTFPRTMSENTLAVSALVRIEIIGSHGWNCLRNLVKCLILLHHRINAQLTHGGASLLNVMVSLNTLFAQNHTKIRLIF